MKVSNCCGASPVGIKDSHGGYDSDTEDINICPECKEHCDYEDDEMPTQSSHNITNDGEEMTPKEKAEEYVAKIVHTENIHSACPDHFSIGQMIECHLAGHASALEISEDEVTLIREAIARGWECHIQKAIDLDVEADVFVTRLKKLRGEK